MKETDAAYVPLRDEVHSLTHLHDESLSSSPRSAFAERFSTRLSQKRGTQDAMVAIGGTQSVAEISSRCRAALAAEGLDDSWLDPVVAFVHGHLVGVPRYQLDLPGLAARLAAATRDPSIATSQGTLGLASDKLRRATCLGAALGSHLLHTQHEERLAGADSLILLDSVHRPSHGQAKSSIAAVGTPPSDADLQLVERAYSTCPRLARLRPSERMELLLAPSPLAVGTLIEKATGVGRLCVVGEGSAALVVGAATMDPEGDEVRIARWMLSLCVTDYLLAARLITISIALERHRCALCDRWRWARGTRARDCGSPRCYGACKTRCAGSCATRSSAGAWPPTMESSRPSQRKT